MTHRVQRTCVLLNGRGNYTSIPFIFLYRLQVFKENEQDPKTTQQNKCVSVCEVYLPSTVADSSSLHHVHRLCQRH